MSFADFSNYTTFFPGLIIFITGLNLVLIFLFVNRKYWSKEMPAIYVEQEKAFQMSWGVNEMKKTIEKY